MKKRGQPIPGGDGKKHVICGVCGWSAERVGMFATGRVAHCPGNSRAYAISQFHNHPHHVDRLYPACWCCGGPLGCVICSGIVFDLLCFGGRRAHEVAQAHDGRGAVWASLDALLAHGPLSGQGLAIYPATWVAEFRHQYGGAEAEP